MEVCLILKRGQCFPHPTWLGVWAIQSCLIIMGFILGSVWWWYLIACVVCHTLWLNSLSLSLYNYVKECISCTFETKHIRPEKIVSYIKRELKKILFLLRKIQWYFVLTRDKKFFFLQRYYSTLFRRRIRKWKITLGGEKRGAAVSNHSNVQLCLISPSVSAINSPNHPKVMI